MVRPAMIPLITRVQRLLAEVEGCEDFSQEDIQNALDTYRQEVRYADLCPMETMEDGRINYYEFTFGFSNMDAGVTITDSQGTVITPEFSDPLNGYFKFSTNQTTDRFITGRTYDIHAAMVELLELRYLKAAGKYDVSSDGQSFKRSQVAAAILEAIKLHTRKVRMRVVYAYRGDT